MARVLASADLGALSQKRAATRQGLLRQEPEKRGFGLTFRPRLVEAVAVLILIAAVFTVRPLRAVGQDVVRGIGHLLFSQGPTSAEERFTTEGGIRFDDVAAPRHVTLEQA